MKKMLKHIISILLAITLICTICSVSSEAASTRKCYGISSGNIRVFKNSGLSKEYGWIYGNDEITVLSVNSKYCKVNYPTSKGRKTGYISTGAILWGTGGKTYKAHGKITTYKRPGGSSYGYIAKNDTVTVLGKKNDYVQVKYPVSFGYKYGFITSSDADKYIFVIPDIYSDISNGTYYLHSKVAPNKSLDVSEQNSGNGTNIHIWETNNTDAQKFTIERLSNGGYKILTFCGKSLDVDNSSAKDGVNVLQWEYHGGTNQQWRFISAGNGYYYIRSSLGKYLDVSEGKSASGTNVQMWTGNSTNAQKWKLEKVNPPKENLSYGLYKNSSAHISCGFDGYKNTRGRHEGIDITWYYDAPIYALVSGTVVNVKTGKNGINGLSTIAIYDSSVDKTVIYLHANPSNVWINKYVNKGDKIGTQGWRGLSSKSSSHTHVEVRNGKKTLAAKSVNDYTLDNPNPTNYWNSKGYDIK